MNINNLPIINVNYGDGDGDGDGDAYDYVHCRADQVCNLAREMVVPHAIQCIQLLLPKLYHDLSFCAQHNDCEQRNHLPITNVMRK
jgi:hypothetical protein